jgi:hypothetical protein
LRRTSQLDGAWNATTYVTGLPHLIDRDSNARTEARSANQTEVCVAESSRRALPTTRDERYIDQTRHPTPE